MAAFNARVRTDIRSADENGLTRRLSEHAQTGANGRPDSTSWGVTGSSPVQPISASLTMRESAFLHGSGMPGLPPRPGSFPVCSPSEEPAAGLPLDDLEHGRVSEPHGEVDPLLNRAKDASCSFIHLAKYVGLVTHVETVGWM
jgi:hypothetical protein